MKINETMRSLYNGSSIQEEIYGTQGWVLSKPGIIVAAQKGLHHNGLLIMGQSGPRSMSQAHWGPSLVPTVHTGGLIEQYFYFSVIISSKYLPYISFLFSKGLRSMNVLGNPCEENFFLWMSMRHFFFYFILFYCYIGNRGTSKRPL